MLEKSRKLQLGAVEVTDDERRRAPRHALKTRVALKTERAIFFMESVDVSTSGIRLQSEIPIEVGTRCRLVPFFEDLSTLFEARGRIVRVADAPADQSQLGIQFDALSQAELEALLGILSRADADIAPLRAAQG